MEEFRDINVTVGGPQNEDAAKIYKTVVLKNNLSFEEQVTEADTKYVVKWEYELQEDLEMPAGCLLEFDGGKLIGNNHSLAGNNTILIYTQELEDILQNVELTGSWIHRSGAFSVDDSSIEIDDNNQIRVKAGGISRDMLASNSVDSSKLNSDAVDGEDIYLNDNNKIQLKDKDYDPENYSGLGRVYVRKQVAPIGRYFDLIYPGSVTIESSSLTARPDGIVFVTASKEFMAMKGGKYYRNWTYGRAEDYKNPGSFSGVFVDARNYKAYHYTITGLVEAAEGSYETGNVLLQRMMNKENTIYHIQYDHNLCGDYIEVPGGCVLEFEGGSLKDGTLVGNGTAIKCNSDSIFDNIHIDGSWLVPTIYSEWFVDIHEDNKLNELINLCNTAIHNTVYIADTEEQYMVSVKANEGAGLNVNKANTEIILRGTIKMTPNKFQKQYCVFISESNISINGGGKIIGDKDEHDYTTISSTHEWGFGIYISGRKTLWSDEELIYNISICNIEVTNCAGDCICFNWAQKINIDNVYLHNARRQGISGTNYAGEIYITNFKITDIHGTAPSSGIDLELDDSASYYGRNYVIENGYIADCILGICASKNNAYAASTSNNTSIKNITFANDDEEFVGCFTNGCLLFANNRNINVQNIVCTKENVQFFECRGSENIIVSNATGGHIKINGVSGGITFNNSNFSSSAARLIYDESLLYGGSKQNLNIVFNNCNLLSTNYAFCYSLYPNNKCIQFNNCKINAGTLVVMNQNALYFYRCNISCTNEMHTGEFHDCSIKVVTENQQPIRWVSSYNSTFDITLNCPSSSSYPGSVGKPFDFSANNIVFKDNVVTVKSDLTKPLNSLFNIGAYQGHPFKDIKVINNKFIIAMDDSIQLATVYRAFIGPDSGIVVSNYGLYSNQGAKTDRPNLKLVVNNRLSYPGVGTTGFKYYDTTLNKSITWNGTNWVDESNNVVTYPITFNLTNLTSTKFVTPDKEAQYTFKLKAYTDYSLPSSITVKMGASTLTSGTDYTYDSSTGDVVVLGAGGTGGVTGTLTITASGVTA